MAKSLAMFRYPGSKSKIYDKVKALIETNVLGNWMANHSLWQGCGIHGRYRQVKQ